MPDTPTTTSALLRHTLPDGSAHLDWLIDRPTTQHTPHGTPTQEHRLITFRCQSDPAQLAHSPDRTWTGTRIPDHRAFYLTHEGPVPPKHGCQHDRGTVRRLWRHPAAITTESPTRIELTLHLPDRPITLHLTPLSGSAHPPDQWSATLIHPDL